MAQNLVAEQEAPAETPFRRSRVRESLFWSTALDVVRNPMGAIGLTLVVGLIVLGVAAPLIARYDPLMQIRGHRLEGPSTTFWFGTDEFSRDLFSRTIYGLRASLLVSVLAVG